MARLIRLTCAASWLARARAFGHVKHEDGHVELEDYRDVTQATRDLIGERDYMVEASPTDSGFRAAVVAANGGAINEDDTAGGVVGAVAVRFVRPTYVYRLWGGATPECAAWWHAFGEAVEAAHDLDAYMDAVAICPEWLSGDKITRCTVEAGYVAVVGPGNKAECADGTVLDPPESVLQIYAATCDDDFAYSAHVSDCVSCDTNKDDLLASACFA